MRGLVLSEDDRIRAKLIETLMCYFEIDLKTFCASFGIDPDYFDDAIIELAGLQEKGLVEIKDFIIRVPADARQAVRLVCAAFDGYLQTKGNRHSQVA